LESIHSGLNTRNSTENDEELTNLSLKSNVTDTTQDKMILLTIILK